MKSKTSKIRKCARTQYVKMCPYCGKEFRVEYPYFSYMAYVDAKDTVTAYRNSHMSFCCHS